MTILVKFSATGHSMVGQDCTRDDFSVAAVAYPGGGPSSATYDYTDPEVVAQTYVSNSGYAYKLAVTQNGSLPPVQITNLTPGVITINPDLTLSKVVPSIPAACQLLAKGATGEKLISYTIPADSVQSITVPYARQPNTLLASVSNNAIAVVAGKTAGDGTQQHYLAGASFAGAASACSATDNPNYLLAGFDLSWRAFSRSDSGRSFPMHLVGPRHVVYNAHISPANGITLIFRRPDGSFTSAKLIYQAKLGNDAACGMLDQDITGCAFAKFLPSTYTDHLKYGERYITKFGPFGDGPMLGFSLTVNPSEAISPGAYLSQGPHAVMCGFREMYSGVGSTYSPIVTFVEPLYSTYAFWSIPYSGDSGSPCILLVTQGSTVVPVLLTSLYTASTGPNWAMYKTAVESALNAYATSIGYNYTLSIQTVDLSAFSIIS